MGEILNCPEESEERKMHGHTMPHAFGLTHPGLLRTRNEDRYLITEPASGRVLVAVIDGMGGQPAGDLAAELARERLAAFPLDEAGPDDLHKCIAAINNDLEEAEERDPNAYGLGCTVTAALIHERSVHWIHVGDCRLYHLRASTLTQITTDHNMAQFLHEEGKLAPEELRTSPMRNLLDQACGGSFMAADSGAFAIAPGEMLLFSSDGLHDELAPEEIAALLCLDDSIEAMAQALIAAALKAGGKDNVTVVLMRW